MVRIPKKLRWTTRLLTTTILLSLAFGTSLFAQGQRYKTDKAWSFGVHGDTQWTIGTALASPLNVNYVSKSILIQVDQKFVEHGVKFVLTTGDMADYPALHPRPTVANPNPVLADSAINERATIANTDLISKGIGFFPMRGNHETYGYLAAYELAPFNFSIPLFRYYFPQTQGFGSNLFGANNFSSPNIDLQGLSYSFDYGSPSSSARFVILDTQLTSCSQTKNYNGVPYPYICTNYPIGAQQEWISGLLDKNTRLTTHAFVLSHQPPMAQNHTDTPFSPFTSRWDPAYYTDYNVNGAQDTFFASMQNNDVRYYLSGHDHLHQRSIVKSLDGNSQLQEIIATGLSTKFYEPLSIPTSVTDDKWRGQKIRETSLSQELHNIGYYVYTVDGPRVNGDYYSVNPGNFQSDTSYPYGPAGAGAKATPLNMTFEKKESFGYSLNGQQFLVAEGESYAVVQDSFKETSARILAGANNDPGTDFNNRVFTKAVNTGWVEKDGNPMLASNIFSLWGMTELGKSSSDVYVLQMSYVDQNPTGLPTSLSGYRLATVDANGKWVRAVDKNIGSSTKTIVRGPWNSSYPLGTQGIDGDKVWAVVDYDADFVVYNFPVLATQTSGFVYNRSTKKYTGTLILTNNSEGTITQGSVVLTKLVSGATLVGASGTTAAGPYITTSFVGGLKPGQSVRIPITLTFTGTANATFIPVTYAN
jgi:hypothetical protein